MNQSFRKQLIRIQKRNYRRNLKIMEESLAVSPQVHRYEREYGRHLKKYQEISSKQELLKKITAAHVVYHGDYHTLSQSQRAVLRLLREAAEKRSVVLCLEVFHGTDQKWLQAFLEGKLGEKAFLKKIQYEKKWPFRWQYWSRILQFCKSRKIPVLGINSERPNGTYRIQQRDAYAARVIAKARIRYPDSLIYVVDGDYHISPDHLPRKVETLLNSLDVPTKKVILYQNAESLYWKLCEEGREDAHVLKVNDESFCIMNTLPANKIQSYLNWLEFSQEAYFPTPREWEDESMEGEGLTVGKMVNIIAQVLDLSLPKNVLDRLTLYYADNYDFMDAIKDNPQLKTSLKKIRDKIKRDEGFLLEFTPENSTEYIIYLPNSNVNMAAEEAAHFVNAVARGQLQRSLSAFDAFYRSTLTECLGYFGSKFINEKRRAQTEHSIRQFLGMVKNGRIAKVDPIMVEGAHLLLSHFHLEKKVVVTEEAVHKERIEKEFAGKFTELYLNKGLLNQLASTQLGYALGNKLFYAVKREGFPLKKVASLFQNNLSRPREAFHVYLDLSRKVRHIRAAVTP